MKFFKPSWEKILIALVVCSFLVFLYAPVVFQYCQPIPGEFGGGGCGPNIFQGTDYTLSQIFLHGLPPEDINMKNYFFPLFGLPIFLIALLSYVLSCIIIFSLEKMNKTKETYAVKSKR